MITMENGKTYNITHCRKGSFTFKVIDHDGTIGNDAEWVTGLITKGHTKTMLPENRKFEGEEETVRLSFLTKIEEVKNA
jgi:hypothetical protein